MWNLSIYASVTEHDKWRKYDLIRQFRDLGADPKELDGADKIEIRFTGNREAVLRLAEVCESCLIHSIHVGRPEH